MPPIIQNKKTYIVSIAQLLAWKKITNDLIRRLLVPPKIIEIRNNNLIINNNGKIEAIYENGKSEQIASKAP
jgi:hypothetical protein